LFEKKQVLQGGGVTRVKMKGTYATSSRPRTCGAELNVVRRTGTEWIRSVAMKKTMIYMAHIMTNLLDTAHP
jgi:hypothetical protein